MSDPDRTKGLPEQPEQLISLADRIAGSPISEKPPAARNVDRALAALERALAKAPHKRFEILWRLARACFRMTENLSDKSQIHTFATRGVEYAKDARSLNPGRVEPHYFLALNMARVAEVTSNAGLAKAMMEPARRAARIDERYDDAGPLRFLGKVYLSAPAWPVSVGDPMKAVQTLERAVKVVPAPLNRVFLGEAYYHDEEYEAAERQLRRALNDPRAARMDERWRKEARDYLNRIAAGATSDPRTNL